MRDGLSWMGHRADRRRLPERAGQIVGNIHDAFVAYIDEGKALTIVPQVVDIVSSPPFHQLGWNPPLKFTVEAEVGQKIAALKKWRMAAYLWTRESLRYVLIPS